MYIVDSFPFAMICMFLGYVIGEAYVNNGFVMLINVTSPEIRSMQGGLNMVYSVTGASTATLLLGQFNTSHDALRNMLLITCIVGYIGGSFMYYCVSRYYPDDLERDKDLPDDQDLLQDDKQVELNDSLSHTY